MTQKENSILTLKGVRVALTGYDEKGDLFCNYLKSSDGASTFNYDTKSYEECKELIEAMEGVVDSDLSSETQFIVARKGLTRKRLMGEKHGMWIVSPLFLDDASHNYELVKQHGATSTKVKINDLQRIAGMYSVPYLYNYVLSASLLTNTEEETSLRRVVEQNGGRYYSAPLAFTDAVFISSEAATNLKLWIQRVVKDTHFMEAVEELAERKHLRGGNRLSTLRELLYQPSEPVVNTEEILFAIVYDIPILNYHKFLTLSQLPPSGSQRKEAASVPPYDFDQLIEFCEVPVPVSLVNVLRFIESQHRDSLEGVMGSQSGSPVRELAPKINNVMHSFSEDSSEADELESIASSFADYMEQGGDNLYSVPETGGTVEGDYFSQTANSTHRANDHHLAPMVSKYFSVRPLEEGALALKPQHSSKPETLSNVKEKPFPLAEKETTREVEFTVDRRRLNLDFNSILFSSLQVAPFLTVAFLHCTPSEEIEGSIRCVGCRFLRVPILTGDVDVVILGKKCLRKKKYTPLSREKGPSKPKKQLREPSLRGRAKGEVCFYECTDHDLFHSLEKGFGITKNRIAPCAWLKECFQLMQEVIDTPDRVPHRTVKQDGNSVQSTWVEETAEAPTQSLYFTETVESVNPKEPPTFDPKPFYASTVNPHTGTVHFASRSLVEHFLPHLQAIGTGKYTIKLSRSVPPIVQRDPSPIKVEQSLKIGKAPSAVTVTAPVAPPPVVQPPDTVQLTAPFTRPAEDHRTVPMERKVTAKSDPPAKIKTIPPTPEDRYHREVQEIKQRLDSLWAIISSDETSEKTIQKTTVFKNVIFCFVEDEFSRTDLGVVRGLVNMGSGKCQKKTNDEWRQALSQQSSSLSDSTSNDTKPIRMNSLLGKKRKRWEELLQRFDPSDSLALKQRIRDGILSVLTPSTETPESSNPFPNHDSQWITDFSHSMSLSHFHLDNVNGNNSSNSAVGNPSFGEIENLIDSIPKLMRLPSRVAAFYVEPHSFQTPSIYLAEGSDRKQADRAGGKKKNALRYLYSVTSDYLVCCLAAKKLLNPRSCFLFFKTIPSAPDLLLLKHRDKNRTVESNPPNTGKGITPPAPSPWLSLHKRYIKPNTTGVCCSFVWRLPRRCMEFQDGRLVPNTETIPVLRSLLYGFNNVVTTLRGKMSDSYHPNSVTHVVVVDVNQILQTPFSLFFDAEDFQELAPQQTLETQSLLDTTDANFTPKEWETGSTCYWPEEELREAMIDNKEGTQESTVSMGTSLIDNTSRNVSIVGVDYLSVCCTWGIFVDETAPEFSISLEDIPQGTPPPLPPNTTPPLQPQPPNKIGTAADKPETASATPERGSLSHSGSHVPVPCTPPPRRPVPRPEQRLSHHTPNRLRTESSRSRTVSINTRTVREQEEENAYLNHLAEVYNFKTPSSTPMGSTRSALTQSARRKHLRDSSVRGGHQASPTQALSQSLLLAKLSQSSPQKEAKVIPSNLATPFLTFIREESREKTQSIPSPPRSNSNSRLLQAGVVCTPPSTPRINRLSRKRSRDEGEVYVPETRHHNEPVGMQWNSGEDSSRSVSAVTPWNPTNSGRASGGGDGARKILAAKTLVPETAVNTLKEYCTSPSQHCEEGNAFRGGSLIGDSENASPRTTGNLEKKHSTHFTRTVEEMDLVECEGSSQEKAESLSQRLTADEGEGDQPAKIGKSCSPPPQEIRTVIVDSQEIPLDDTEVQKQRGRTASRPLSLASRSITPLPDQSRLRDSEEHLLVYVLHDVPSRQSLMEACQRPTVEGSLNPPVVFTQEVTKAAVVVASVINSRESLLCGIVAGKWIVLPAWLQKVGDYMALHTEASLTEKQGQEWIHRFTSWLPSFEWGLEAFQSTCPEPSDKEKVEVVQAYWLNRGLAKTCAVHRQKREIGQELPFQRRRFIILSPLLATSATGKRSREPPLEATNRPTFLDHVLSVKKVILTGGGSVSLVLGIASEGGPSDASDDRILYEHLTPLHHGSEGLGRVPSLSRVTGGALPAASLVMDLQRILLSQVLSYTTSTEMEELLVHSVEKLRVRVGHKRKKKKSVLHFREWLRELQDVSESEELLQSIERPEEEKKAYYFWKRTLRLVGVVLSSMQGRSPPPPSSLSPAPNQTVPLALERGSSWDSEWKTFIETSVRSLSTHTVNESTRRQVSQYCSSSSSSLWQHQRPCFTLHVKNIDCIARAVANIENSDTTLATFTL